MLSFALTLCAWAEHAVLALVLLALLEAWVRGGRMGVLTAVVGALRTLRGVRLLLDALLTREVADFVRQIKAPVGGGDERLPVTSLPKQGLSASALLAELGRLKAAHKSAAEGRLFAYVYTGEGEAFELQKRAVELFAEKTGVSEEHDHLLYAFYQGFMHENALSPMAFPALRQFETEIVSMTAAMLHGDADVTGSVTSGGTESVLMALKTYRDRARALFPHITRPEMVAPVTIHPAHEKAAHYFDIRIVHVPVGQDGLPNVDEYERAITPNTIAMLCSAPQYCHGVVDPIEGLAGVALRRGLPLHVDACFGGFMLPWVEKLGYAVPKFDFRLPGVTSMSADIHKYGFGCKGASVVLYRDAALRKHQFFVYSDWPGGLFGSPTMAGTRPGGNLAAAWCALMHMGEEGYTDMARTLMDVTDRLTTGINRIPGLAIVGQPAMTSFAVRATDPTLDVLALADVMERHGWTLERQQDSLHFSIMPHHVACAEQLIADLANCLQELKGDVARGRVVKGSAGMYGMMAKVPRSIVDDFILEFFNQVYQP